ncbi:acetoacetate decarboxylase family protein [Streptomyces actuosus]|uniref:acetoacetate decarboxylase family protein n=1 Tax=Streptomyces actuosus TaxID=1885 RepID=UPI001F055ADA|nr:acetoacetate decarboxylase family protein [Streptomyces actuosus]
MGGPAALDEFVRTEVEVRAEEMWRGTGAPAFTGHSEVDPLHRIPVVEPVETVLGIDMTLTPLSMEPVSVHCEKRPHASRNHTVVPQAAPPGRSHDPHLRGHAPPQR